MTVEQQAERMVKLIEVISEFSAVRNLYSALWRLTSDKPELSEIMEAGRQAYRRRIQV